MLEVGVEDLCLDFTLPGYSNIRLKKGGGNESVNAENIDEYLQVGSCIYCYILLVVCMHICYIRICSMIYITNCVHIFHMYTYSMILSLYKLLLHSNLLCPL